MFREITKYLTILISIALVFFYPKLSLASLPAEQKLSPDNEKNKIEISIASSTNEKMSSTSTSLKENCTYKNTVRSIEKGNYHLNFCKGDIIEPTTNEIKRTSNSITWQIEQKLITRFYGVDRFYQEKGKIYEIIIEKNNVSFFLEESRQRRLIKTAWAYDDSFYSGAGDGNVFFKDSSSPPSQSGWDTAHDSTNGTSADYTNALRYAGIGILNHTTQAWDSLYIVRLFFPFDTSDLPNSSIVIDSATLVITPNAISDHYSSDDNSKLSVYETMQADPTVLAVGDYSEYGTTSLSEDLDVTDDFVVNTPEEILLTSTSVVSQTGYTLLGVRSLFDVNDDWPGCPAEDNTYHNSYVQFYMSEQTGTGYDPYLEIVYSDIPASTLYQERNLTVSMITAILNIVFILIVGILFSLFIPSKKLT